MSFIKLGLTEMKKLFQQPEIYIALFLCTVYYYLGLRDTGDSFNPTSGLWRAMLDAVPWFGFWMIAVLVVIGSAKCLPIEREQEMNELLLTYKKGQVQLLMVKQAVMFIYCAIIVSYFYLVSFFTLVTKYSISGAFNQIKVNPPVYFINANPDWTFAQLLLFQFGYMVLASYIFSLCILALSFFIKRSVFIMMIAGSVFALEELYDKYLCYYTGSMKLDVYLRNIYDYGFNGMLGHQYLEGLSPFSEGEIYILFMVFALLLFAFNLAIGRWRRYASVGN